MGNGMNEDAMLLPTAVALEAEAEAEARFFFCMCVWLWYARTQMGKANSTIVLNIRRTMRSTRWGQQRKRGNPMR
jgi:hypothetical protein